MGLKTYVVGNYQILGLFILLSLLFILSFKNLKQADTRVLKISTREPHNLNKKSAANENGNTLEENEDDVVILGSLKKNAMYAVFSTTSEGETSLNFIFYLPLTSLAWKRIGFESVVIIVGSYNAWKRNKLLSFVLENLKKLEVVVVFLKTEPESATMTSQVSRLFVANILLEKFPDSKDTYLVTTDTDLWPLSKEAYVLTAGKKILSLNSECCNPFKHGNKMYKMLPLSNIGMSISMWSSVMSKFNLVPATPKEMKLYMVKEFGDVASRAVVKGENVGWFMDQHAVSMAIETLRLKNSSIIKYSPRSVGFDRIDKNQFTNDFIIEDKIDSHLPNDVLKKIVFLRVHKLLKLMFMNNQNIFDFMKYYGTFVELLQS